MAGPFERDRAGAIAPLGGRSGVVPAEAGRNDRIQCAGDHHLTIAQRQQDGGGGVREDVPASGLLNPYKTIDG